MFYSHLKLFIFFNWVGERREKRKKTEEREKIEREGYFFHSLRSCYLFCVCSMLYNKMIARTKQTARRRSASAPSPTSPRARRLANLKQGRAGLGKRNAAERDKAWAPDTPLKRKHTEIITQTSSHSPPKRVMTRVRYTNNQKRKILQSYDQAENEHSNSHFPQIFALISDLHPALGFNTMKQFLRDRSQIELSTSLESHGVSEARVYV